MTVFVYLFQVMLYCEVTLIPLVSQSWLRLVHKRVRTLVHKWDKVFMIFVFGTANIFMKTIKLFLCVPFHQIWAGISNLRWKMGCRNLLSALLMSYISPKMSYISLYLSYILTYNPIFSIFWRLFEKYLVGGLTLVGGRCHIGLFWLV